MVNRWSNVHYRATVKTVSAWDYTESNRGFESHRRVASNLVRQQISLANIECDVPKLPRRRTVRHLSYRSLRPYPVSLFTELRGKSTAAAPR